MAKCRIIVPDGNYDGDLTSWASDVYVVASDGAVLNGSILINAANRIRWSGDAIDNSGGGAINSSSGDSGIILRETDDIVFDDRNLRTRNGGFAIRRGGARYAIINTQLKSFAQNGWGLHTLRNGSY